MNQEQILTTAVDYTRLRPVQKYAKALGDDRLMIVKRAGSKTYDIVWKNAKLGPGDKDYKVM